MALFTIGAALYLARPVFIPITAAFVLSVILAPATEWLRRRSFPAGFRALLVIAIAFSLFVGGLYLAVQPGAAWIERFPGVMEQAREKLTGVQDAVSKVQDVSEQVSELTDLGAVDTEVVTVQGPKLGDALVASARTIIVQIIFIAVLTYFFLAARTDLRRKLALMRSDFAGMRQTTRMVRSIEEKVGSYMFTMFIINLGLGCATALGMWLIGMPSPLVWGGLAAALNFIPYLGPVLLTILLTITGIVNYDTLIGIMTPAAIYVVLNFIESNFITPTLVGVKMTISPLAIILNVSFWTWMWGPAGAIISIPLLVIFKTICDHSVFLKPIGLLIGKADTFRPLKA
ncbi:MAG: AI-2E family transporter [Pseudomonadota bacterium]